MNFYADDLINEINNNGKCNFIAYAVTFLHVIGINATIKWFLDNGIKLSGYVLILAHPITGKILEENDFQLDNTDIVVKDYTGRYRGHHHAPLRSRLLALKESSMNHKGNKLYILWTELDYRWYEIMSHINWKYQLCYIRIDDGGSSYTNGFRNSFQAEMYEDTNSRIDICKSFCRIFCRYTFNKLLKSQLIAHGNYIDNRIFKISRRGKMFIPNEEILPYYKMELKKIDDTIPMEVISKCSNSILINTQSLVENKMTDGYLDLNLYKEVVNISKEIGLKVTLKPHPRELDIEKYEHLGVNLIPSKVSQEAILANLERAPKCIISIFSSTLLNAQGLFDIPVISLAKLMLKEDINEGFKRQLKDFIKQYNSMFLFPESYEKLKDIIQSL